MMVTTKMEVITIIITIITTIIIMNIMTIITMEVMTKIIIAITAMINTQEDMIMEITIMEEDTLIIMEEMIMEGQGVTMEVEVEMKDAEVEEVEMIDLSGNIHFVPPFLILHPFFNLNTLPV